MQSSVLDLRLPSWWVLVFAAIFWAIHRLLKPHVRTWALATFPATVLHELAHAIVGGLTGARPSSFSLWPKRVGATSWRLGYVGFLNLRWWNGGLVALAPMLWALAILALVRIVPDVPSRLALRDSLIAGVGIVWLWIAVAPGRTDWTLARQNWPSALAFLVGWTAAAYALVDAGRWLRPFLR